MREIARDAVGGISAPRVTWGPVLLIALLGVRIAASPRRIGFTIMGLDIS